VKDKPKQKRLVAPPAGSIPEGAQVAKVSPASGEAWSYQGEPGQTGHEATAALFINPAMTAGQSIRTFNGYQDHLELHGIVNELHTQIAAVNAGDMSRPEAMLVAQAHALDSMFYKLMARANSNMGEYLDAAETYFRLGLRMQSQCRATLETLGQLKNPSQVAFVKQANIANGPQQVNNGTPSDPARVVENEIPPTKLLEDQHDKWMDPGAQEAASRLNQALEALGALDRPEDARGKGEGEPKRIQGRHKAAIA
jgi:hypothetical protein